MLSRLRHLWSAISRRSRFESDMDSELRFHIDSFIADLVRSGVSREEAARRARVEFGSVDSAKEECRQARGLEFADELSQNLRYAWRSMRHSPGFASAAILSLALGIGVNTAIFSLIDAVLLRSLPVGNPGQLYFIGHGASKGTKLSVSSNYALFDLYRSRTDVFSGVTAASSSEYKMDAGAGVEIVRGMLASGNFHAVLEVPITLGRGFNADNDRSFNPVAVISHRLWTERFGRDPGVLGKTVYIDGKSVNIIGVTAPDFFGVMPGYPVDITLSMSMAPQFRRPDYFTDKTSWISLTIIGRLRPGISPTQAETVANGVFQQFLDDPAARWVRERSAESFQAARFEPAAKGLSDLRKKFSKPLWVLFGMVGLVLAVACANTSSLLLARATARQREIAVRLSLGVSQFRLLRQLLTESLVLALAGGAAGAVLALWCTGMLLRFFAAGEYPIQFQVSPNLRVLAFTALVAIVCGILFGLAPALRALKVDTNSALKGHAGATGRFTAGNVIVAAQVAICVLLLSAAGLLTQTLRKLQEVDVGFDRHHLLLATLDMRASGKPLLADISQRLSALPGVRSVSFSDTTPLSTSGTTKSILVPGYSAPPSQRMGAWVTWVSPRYFETFGIQLLRGRAIADSDRAGSRPVAVVSQSMARKFFAGADPVGRHFQFGSAKEKNVEIAGMVSDALQDDPRKPPTEIVYIPLDQSSDSQQILVAALRTSRSPMSLAAQMRSEVRAVSKNIAVPYVRTMPQQLNALLLNENLLARLSSFFAILAAALACVGLYGVMAYTVARRTREMGVRVALGATSVSVRWLVIRQALAVAAVGLAIGLPAALFASRSLEGLLFQVSAKDPATYLGVAALLGASAIFAAYWPARAASRVNPTTALRTE